jgi:predicted CXXCH cytochrome family protein
MTNDPLRIWQRVAIAAAAVIVVSVPAYVLKQSIIRATRAPALSGEARFVGREQCIDCHREAYEAWRGSDHDRAMDVASDSTVFGDFDNATFSRDGVTARFYRRDGRFFVYTQGPGGVPGEFEISYTFGFEPLQQYLVRFPGGRLQCLTIAWDTVRKEWFSLYPGQKIPPDDWLYWTRNAQNWNGMCAECHSTNLVKNYDADTKTFATTWSEIDVSCEACHGPGSRHVEWAKLPPMARPASENYELVIRTGSVTAREQVELCAPCHSRRTEMGDYDHRKPRLLDNVVPALLDEGLYYPDGQILEEVYVYGSFVQSKMFKNGIRCGDCHDVHRLKLVKDGNALCTRCHQADVYDSYEHHFHKSEFEGKPSDGHLCVKCHMPERPYMVVDWRADHSIRIPRPDLTREIGTPNACTQSGCHADKPLSWVLDRYENWYGKSRKPHYGTIIAAGRAQRPEARSALIRLAGDPLYPAIVRATALSLLERYPGEESTEAFNRALSDEDPLIRHTAVDRVIAPSPERLYELVSPLLFDPVRAVRLQAAVRLAGLPDGLFKPYQREALDKATDDYIAAMKYSLDFSYAGHNLGNLYVALGDPEKAERYYKTAIEIDDLFYPAKANLAVLYNTQGRNEETERLLREILSAYPDQHDAEYSLGLVLAEMKRYDEAVTYLDRAARAMPERARVFYNLGLAAQAANRLDEAETALQRAFELEPSNFDIMHALADHYLRRGEYQRALPLAERMIAAQPNNPAGGYIKGQIENALRSGAGD